MATISKLLSFIVLLLMLANKLAHSQVVTSFSYSNFSSAEGLTYQGVTNVPSGSNFLRLAKVDSSEKPESWNIGRVLYSSPVNFYDVSSGRQASFDTKIVFLITPSKSGAADGFVFFIAPVNTTIPSGSNGGNFGIFGSNGLASSVFAVEFDTFPNPWDPRHRHIGIDMESRRSITNTTFDSGTGQLVRATITYDATTNIINVVAKSGTNTASLSYVFDLKTILHEQVQVGLASAVGEDRLQLGVTNVIHWSFTSSLVYTKNVGVDEKAYIRQYNGME